LRQRHKGHPFAKREAYTLRRAIELFVAFLPGAGLAGTVSGFASPPTPLPLPAEAVFEAVLIDAALADAPARELGRMRRQPTGQALYQFTIPFRDADLDPRGR
jgi:uncharacterized lipoprotein YbaY